MDAMRVQLDGQPSAAAAVRLLVASALNQLLGAPRRAVLVDPAGGLKDMRSGWVAVLLLSLLVTAAAHFIFWSSPPGRRILDGQRQQTIDRMRGRLPAETLDRLARAEMGYRQTAIGAAVGRSMGILVPVLLWTAAVHLIGSTALLRPDVGFRGVLAIFSRGSVIWMLAQLFAIALMWLDGEPRAGTAIASLVPRAGWPDPSTFAGALATRADAADLLWLPVVASGVARVYGVKVWLVLASIAAVKLALVLTSAALFRPPAGGGAIAPFGH